jgi:hypothetical protein
MRKVTRRNYKKMIGTEFTLLVENDETSAYDEILCWVAALDMKKGMTCMGKPSWLNEEVPCFCVNIERGVNKWGLKTMQDHMLMVLNIILKDGEYGRQSVGTTDVTGMRDACAFSN